jgi:hypothetical protein
VLNHLQGIHLLKEQSTLHDTKLFASHGSGRWFRISLLASIGLMIAFAALSLGGPFLDPSTLDIIAGLLGLIALPFLVVLSISFLVWTYKVHCDLKAILGDYPISPGGAIARVLIPVYNLWGYWNLWKTAGEYLPVRPNGRAIEEVLPWFYGAFLLGRALGRAVRFFPESLWVEVFSILVDLALYVTLYMLYEATTYGLRALVTKDADASREG